MADIVLIPTWGRAELLHFCLEQIRQSELAEKLHYLFKVDFGEDKDIWKVIDDFPFSHEVVHEPPNSLKLGKLSNNILKGYQYAYDHTDRYVFMIESDVLIANDFFRWHYAVQAENEVFCSIASENTNTKFPVTNRLENYYLGAKTDYQSLGVCFRKEIVSNFIRHLNNDYLGNPVNYCRKTFPSSIFGTRWVEQAGLIRRELEQSALYPAFPDVPRCYHAGFYGKNRNMNYKPPGLLEEKIETIQGIIFDDARMREHAGQRSFYEDSRPINLNNKPWEALQLRQ